MDKANLSLLDEIEKKVEAYTPNPEFPDDKFIMITLQEAIAAAREGNIGVGAVLVRKNGEIVQRGHNHLFNPHFRSDLHAEMDVMTKFEERFQDVVSMEDYALFTSLEPCPMCLTRLICSGVRKVFYAAEDKEGANVRGLKSMPPIWIKLSEKQHFSKAQCSTELRDIALQVFMLTVEEANNKLLKR